MNRINNISFSLLFVLFCITAVSAQSGRKDPLPSPTPGVNVPQKVTSETRSDNQNLEKVRFIISSNLPQLVSELNKLGKLGYRVEKAFNFGATDTQRFATVLKLEGENTFEYDWLTSPNKYFLEGRLNFRAEKGFNVVQTFGVTACGDKSYDSDKDANAAINSQLLTMTKGDIFLLERKNKVEKKTKDYKAFVAKIGIGKNPSSELQTALDTVSKEYRPLKVLFRKGGWTDFSVSILLEDDLESEASQKTVYKFIKEVNGFDKEVNSLSQTGYKFLSGRRIGLIRYALLAKDSDEAVSYSFIDQNEFEKELPKKYQPGSVFHGFMDGDSSCDSDETVNGKLVFEQKKNTGAKDRDYKYFRLTAKPPVKPTEVTEADVNKLLAENYILENVFYSDGVVIIFSK